LSSVLNSTATHRLDAEYYQKAHIADADLVRSQPERFQTVSDLECVLDASAFYPGIESEYGRGSLPFLRVGDVNGFVDADQAVTIPAHLCEIYPTLNSVRPGDILFTKGGAIDRVGIVDTEAAVSRDLISLSASELGEAQRRYLFAYFQTPFFRRALVRSSSQTAQPHLTLGLLRNLPILQASDRFQSSISHLVRRSEQAAHECKEITTEAELSLIEQLGLRGWSHE
jgi:hypothetical protein